MDTSSQLMGAAVGDMIHFVVRFTSDYVRTQPHFCVSTDQCLTMIDSRIVSELSIFGRFSGTLVNFFIWKTHNCCEMCSR